MNVEGLVEDETELHVDSGQQDSAEIITAASAKLILIAMLAVIAVVIGDGQASLANCEADESFRQPTTIQLAAAPGLLATAPLDEPSAPALAGTSWRFVEIMGGATPTTVTATLEFSTDGAAEGFSGCNRFSGRYESVGAALTFSGISYTKMWCAAEVMKVEHGVQTALRRTSNVSAPPGELDLVASDGTVLARLIPQ
jgi:heat shock protein HslJ